MLICQLAPPYSTAGFFVGAARRGFAANLEILLPPNLNNMSTLSDHAHIDGQHLRPGSLVMNYDYNPAWSGGAVKLPIFQTSPFVFRNAEEGKTFFELTYGMRQANPDEKMSLIYSRLNNPNLEILEPRLCLCDGAEEAGQLRQRRGGHQHPAAEPAAARRYGATLRTGVRRLRFLPEKRTA